MHHLVGRVEIAAMLGVSRQRVDQLAKSYDDFPAPVAELTAGNVWETSDVEAWMRAHPERKTGRPSQEADG